MYSIVELDSRWVVFVGSAMILSFDRMDAALKTVNDGERLIHPASPQSRSPATEFAIGIAEAARCNLKFEGRSSATTTFVERRRASRTSVEMDAAE